MNWSYGVAWLLLVSTVVNIESELPICVTEFFKEESACMVWDVGSRFVDRPMSCVGHPLWLEKEAMNE